jgi:hypothetical protein
VAFQAERHAEGFVVMHFDHLIDSTMAFYATNTSVDVNSVIEINIVRSFVETNPRDRRPDIHDSITV